VSSQTASSAGDALRELDGMNVCTSDLNDDNADTQILHDEKPFLLVHSPLVSNYDMTPAIEAHSKRRAADKNFIMTMGVHRGGRYAYSRMLSESS
jgi:translation initiation factor eIF-2B subunit epsilon